MEILLDTMNLASIKKYTEILPLAGVTTNPSIVKKEGKVDFYEHLKKIKDIAQVPLHVQVTGETKEEIIRDARAIVDHLGMETYIKIYINQAGLAAIKELKKENFLITATAIYTEFQGYLAIASGVDYLAPYYNRMENHSIDAYQVIQNLANEIDRTKSSAKILGASFKNVSQIEKTCRAGAQSVTIGPDVLDAAFANETVNRAIDAFNKDWKDTYHIDTLADYSG